MLENSHAWMGASGSSIAGLFVYLASLIRETTIFFQFFFFHSHLLSRQLSISVAINVAKVLEYKSKFNASFAISGKGSFKVMASRNDGRSYF